MASNDVTEKKVKELIKSGRYEFSKHAEREREADRISVKELEEALIKCKVIEDLNIAKNLVIRTWVNRS